MKSEQQESRKLIKIMTDKNLLFPSSNVMVLSLQESLFLLFSFHKTILGTFPGALMSGPKMGFSGHNGISLENFFLTY